MTSTTSGTEVAVIGGGPIGIAYALFVKETRPETTVTVLERNPNPGHKIGESTLGTSTRWMRHAGLEYPVLRRLFGFKGGIRFWWTGPGDPELHAHIDGVDVDETFQIERRVLETALIELARRRGIVVRAGTWVDAAASRLDGEGTRLRCVPDAGAAYDLDVEMVCDASGQASALPRALGVYRQDPARFGTFNTNAYYAYYRPRDQVPVELWDEPATRHICFPQGWTWFITVVSWEQTPRENLERMISFLLDRPAGPDDFYPTRSQLQERFGCASEDIMSVGFTVRQDRDTALELPEDERFSHYLERYPAVASILDHYDLVENPYSKEKPYSALLSISHDTTAVTGDRWCAIGDSAMFTNPLLSPGLQYGTGTAFEAAQDSARALAAGDLPHLGFRGYRHYAERTFASLAALNDMLYRSFAHPESYERALALFFFHTARDVLTRDVYSDTEPYNWGLLEPEFTRRVDEFRGVLRRAEERSEDAVAVLDELRAIVDPYVESVLARPEVQALDLQTVLRSFGPDGRLAARRETRPGQFAARRCPTCRQWQDAALPRCPVCGTAAEAAAT